MADEPDEQPQPLRHANSLTRIRTLISHPVEDQQAQTLVAAVEIICEICDFAQRMHIPGHHLPAVIEGLQQIVRDYPELTTAHVTEVTGRTIAFPGGGGRAH